MATKTARWAPFATANAAYPPTASGHGYFPCGQIHALPTIPPMDGLSYFSVAAVGYLLGSIPFGFLLAKSRGVDIRQHGSGNIGATNVLRTLGKKWGVLCFVFDFLKGLIAVWCGFALGDGSSIAGIMAAVACILGHNFPVWLKFKGGKGIATSAGVLIALVPVTAFLLLLVWLSVFFSTRYVSLASLAVAVSLPVIVLIFVLTGWRADWPLFYFALTIGALAIWRHRSNINRLLHGTESRFEKKTKA